MKKNNKIPLAAAMGTIVVSAFTATTANAEANPFAISEMSDGYMQLADAGYNVVPWGGKSAKKANEASCGEGKCGSMMNGDKIKKGHEHACGAMTSDANKAPEAKCGEGKCGSMMDGDKMKKGLEKSCGAMMKGKEGACGDMKKDHGMKGGEMSCGAMMEKMKSGEMSCGAMMEKMKSGKMPCAAMMKKMKGKMGNMDMKDGEMSCSSKIDPAKASGM